MVSINYSSREVCCKIVYYGPGLSGKTTNLQYVHSKVPTNTRGKLISLATEADRTLYFDFLPINIGTINGFAAKFQLYTVPGQVYYNATRKLVLRGVDGIVFVADSQPDKMEENIESLLNLEENLKEYGYDINDLPLVIQYNKRDLPGVLSVEQLNARLNQKGWPFLETSATIGNGVFDTLKLIIKLVLDKAKSRSVTRPVPTPVSSSTPPAGDISEPPVESRPTPEKPAAAPVVTATTPVTAMTDVAASQKRAPADSPRYRPYPGSEDEVLKKEISPTTPPLVQKEKSVDTLTEHKVKVPDSIVEGVTPRSEGTPYMAPTLRRRRKEKKRGFFKRLFGIK